MNHELLEQVLASPRIPSLPKVALQVVSLTERPDVSMHDLAETIKHDQALNAKILRLVNSSAFGLKQNCTTLQQAMVALGVNAVKSLALSFSLVSAVRMQPQGTFDYASYWRRGVHSAVGARAVAASVEGVDPEEVFLAGVLQDVGVIAMLQALGDEYARVVAACEGDHRALCKLEMEAFGFDHATVGAEMLKRWKFADRLVECVRLHERPDEATAETERLLQCLSLGGLAADTLSEGGPKAPPEEFVAKGQERLGVSPEEARELLGRVADEAQSVATLLNIDIGEGVDVEELLYIASERIVEITMAQRMETETLNQRNAELQHAAVTDALTGIANRGHFDEIVREAHRRAIAEHASVSVVFIDADHFKNINDTLGHQAGDEALVEIASRLKRAFEPAGGVVFRYGGEEFAVVLEGHGRAEAALLAESFRESQANDPLMLGRRGSPGGAVTVTASVGVAAIEPETAHAFSTVDKLVRAADQAVYAAKGSGRNCVRVFNPRPRDLAA